MSSNGNRPNEFECTASVDELVRPYGTAREARGTAPPADKCVLTLQQGPREGRKRAFLHRSDLYIYGHRMAKAEFVDVLTTEDQLKVKVISRPQDRRGPKGKHAIDCEVVKAWLGKAPEDKKENMASDGDQDKKGFSDYLKKHNLTEDKFRNCYEGKRPTKPFFPIKKPRLVNTCFVSSLLTPLGEEGATCGVLEVADGPLAKMLWGFDQLCLYICGVRIDCNDLNRLFLAADKGYSEVTSLKGLIF